jgi:mxaJ protein
MGRPDHAIRPLLAALLLAALSSPAEGADRTLRVCADPNNLPFSNEAEEGFENRIVNLVAEELGAEVEYVWWAQRRGFTRNTLEARTCDVWPGIASAIERVATTRPYYRSTYVFVTRADRGLEIASYDDPQLKDLTIGVQMIGDDGANPPPAHALSRRGLIDNVRGYMLYGDYDEPNPPAAIVNAVASGEIDVAVVWGPLAGYFADRAETELTLKPVEPWLDGPRWPMVFDISMGVRKEDVALAHEIDEILERRRDDVQAILTEYHVPLVQ